MTLFADEGLVRSLKAHVFGSSEIWLTAVHFAPEDENDGERQALRVTSSSPGPWYLIMLPGRDSLPSYVASTRPFPPPWRASVCRPYRSIPFQRIQLPRSPLSFSAISPTFVNLILPIRQITSPGIYLLRKGYNEAKLKLSFRLQQYR